MFQIDIERQLTSNIDEVFKALADHQNYQQYRGVDGSTLIEHGTSEPNGVGALREISAGGTVLQERIVAFDPPRRIGYKIEFSKPLPYRHEYGLVELIENKKGVLVRWRSRGHIAIPFLGNWYFDKKVQNIGSRAFSSILKQIDLKLQAENSQTVEDV